MSTSLATSSTPNTNPPPSISEFKFNFIGRPPGLLSRFSDTPAGEASQDVTYINGMDTDPEDGHTTSQPAAHTSTSEAAFAPPHLRTKRKSLLETLAGPEHATSGEAGSSSTNTFPSSQISAPTSHATPTAPLFAPAPPLPTLQVAFSNDSATSAAPTDALQLQYPASVRPSPTRDDANSGSASMPTPPQSHCAPASTPARIFSELRELSNRMSAELAHLPAAVDVAAAHDVAQSAVARAAQAREDLRSAHKTSQTTRAATQTAVATARTALREAEAAHESAESSCDVVYNATQTVEEAQRCANDALAMVTKMASQQTKWTSRVSLLHNDLARMNKCIGALQDAEFASSAGPTRDIARPQDGAAGLQGATSLQGAADQQGDADYGMPMDIDEDSKPRVVPRSREVSRQPPRRPSPASRQPPAATHQPPATSGQPSAAPHQHPAATQPAPSSSMSDALRQHHVQRQDGAARTHEQVQNRTDGAPVAPQQHNINNAHSTTLAQLAPSLPAEHPALQVDRPGERRLWGPQKRQEERAERQNREAAVASEAAEQASAQAVVTKATVDKEAATQREAAAMKAAAMKDAEDREKAARLAAEQAKAARLASEKEARQREAEQEQFAAERAAAEAHRAELLRQQVEMRAKIQEDKERANQHAVAEILAKRAQGMQSASPPASATAELKPTTPSPTSLVLNAPPSSSLSMKTTPYSPSVSTSTSGNYVAKQTLVPDGTKKKKTKAKEAKGVPSGNVKLGTETPPEDVVRAAELGLRTRTSPHGTSASTALPSKAALPPKPVVMIETRPMGAKHGGGAPPSASTNRQAADNIKPDRAASGAGLVKQEDAEPSLARPLASSGRPPQEGGAKKMPAPPVPTKTKSKQGQSATQQQQQKPPTPVQSQPKAVERRASTSSTTTRPSSTRPTASEATQNQSRPPSAASSSRSQPVAAPKPADRRRPQPNANANASQSTAPKSVWPPASQSVPRGPRTPPLPPPPSASTSTAGTGSWGAQAAGGQLASPYTSEPYSARARPAPALRTDKFAPLSPSRDLDLQIGPPNPSPTIRREDRHYSPGPLVYSRPSDPSGSVSWPPNSPTRAYSPDEYRHPSGYTTGQKRPREADYDERPAQRSRTQSGSGRRDWSPIPQTIPRGTFAPPQAAERVYEPVSPPTSWDAGYDDRRSPYERPYHNGNGYYNDYSPSPPHDARGHDMSYESDYDARGGTSDYIPPAMPQGSSKGSLEARLGGRAPPKQGKGRGGHNNSTNNSNSNRGKGRGGKASLSNRISEPSLLARMSSA